MTKTPDKPFGQGIDGEVRPKLLLSNSDPFMSLLGDLLENANASSELPLLKDTSSSSKDIGQRVLVNPLPETLKPRVLDSRPSIPPSAETPPKLKRVSTKNPLNLLNLLKIWLMKLVVFYLMPCLKI